MRRRRTIAVLLGTIYLMAIALPAYFALTCTCHAHALQPVCCQKCAHSVAEDELLHNHLYGPSHSHLASACNCHHNHDTEQNLYTMAGSRALLDSLRCAFFYLPPSLVAENSLSILLPCFDLHRCSLQVDEGPLCGYPPTLGLRAPPVCA